MKLTLTTDKGTVLDVLDKPEEYNLDSGPDRKEFADHVRYGIKLYAAIAMAEGELLPRWVYK